MGDVGVSVSRLQSLITAAVSWGLVTAGVTWEFGPWGLMGSGAVGLVVATAVKIREE